MSSSSQGDNISNSDSSGTTSSSSPLQRIQDWWTELHDAQRLERLQQCRQIEQVLKECQQQSNSSHQKYKHNTIESIVPGIRMMKYFGWRGILQQQQQSEDGSTNDIDSVVNSCAREQHALWACRAVSIGCGNDLSHLKICLDAENDDGSGDEGNDQKPIPNVLRNPVTAYEPKSQQDIDQATCGDFQARLGKCVGQGAQELYHRTSTKKK
jgi:hypothetical protein